MSSRSQASKFAAYHQKTQDASAAKSQSGKFTQKQSKFAIRNEEKVLAAQANGGDYNAPLPRRTSSRRESYQPAPVAPIVPVSQPQKPSAMSAAAESGYNPFSPVVRRSASASKKSGGASSNGDSLPVHPGFVAAQHRMIPQSANAGGGAARKPNRYALTEGAGGDGNQLGEKRGREEIGGLMGGRVVREEDVEAAENAADQGPDSKKNKFERFQELIENTRTERAQNHRDRLEKEQQTAFLDTEFDSIMGLLHRRDKIEEEKLAFKASITPDIQALFDKYRPTGRVAKKLVISSTPVAADAPAAPVIEPLKDPKDKKKSGLAPDSQKLLAQINAKAKDGKAPKEIAAMPLAVSSEVQKAMERQAKANAAVGQSMPSLLAENDNAPIGFGEDGADDNATTIRSKKIDEFDLLMGRMRNEATRMAVATDRVLSEEEIEAQKKRLEQLEEDRAVAPAIDIEQKDLSRKEWLHRGGDLAHKMDADEDDYLDEDLDYDKDYDEEIVYSDDDNANEDDGAEDAGEEDDDAEEGAKKTKSGASSSKTGGLHVVDGILASIELKCKEHVARLSRKKTVFEQVEEARLFKQQIADLSTQLHEACKKHPHYGVESLRLILIALQKQALAAASAASTKSLEDALSPYHLLLLYIMLNVFPVSDFRHEVVTPLFLFLSATIMQARLRTLNDARIVLCLSSLLADGLARGGQRFAAEPLVGAINVFALQLDKSEIEPEKLQGTRLPCPMLSREQGAILALQKNHRVKTANAEEAMAEEEKALPHVVSLTDAMTALAENTNTAAAKPNKKGSAEFLGPKQTAHAVATQPSDTEDNARLSIITSCIKLLSFIVAKFVNNSAGATAAVIDPILALDAMLQSTTAAGRRGNASVIDYYPTNVANLYDDLLAKVAAAKKDIMAFRTPLAMRTFRPKPLRQFEPLLNEMEAVEVQEHKHLKKVLREDRKRLVRNIQAQATVDRKGREREAAEVDAHRTEKYNQLMGELQQQAHIMKTVDSFMDKARSKSRKNPDGASKITKKDNAPDDE